MGHCECFRSPVPRSGNAGSLTCLSTALAEAVEEISTECTYLYLTGSRTLQNLANTWCGRLWTFSHSRWGHRILVSHCISTKRNRVQQLFLYLLPIHISYLVNCLHALCSSFYWMIYYFSYWLVGRSSFYILNSSCLADMCLKCFLLIYGVHFYCLISTFSGADVVNFYIMPVIFLMWPAVFCSVLKILNFPRDIKIAFYIFYFNNFIFEYLLRSTNIPHLLLLHGVNTVYLISCIHHSSRQSRVYPHSRAGSASSESL